jgi:hypothetical protein
MTDLLLLLLNTVSSARPRMVWALAIMHALN